MIRETIAKPDLDRHGGGPDDEGLDPKDYPKAIYEYHTSGPPAVRKLALWVDAFGGCWLESNDGQRVVIPGEIRKKVAQRLKEASF